MLEGSALPVEAAPWVWIIGLPLARAPIAARGVSHSLSRSLFPVNISSLPRRGWGFPGFGEAPVRLSGGEGAKGQHTAQKCPKMCPQGSPGPGSDPDLAAVSLREGWKGRRAAGKAKTGRSGIRRHRTLLKAGLGRSPRGSSCPGWRQPLTPASPYLTLGFPTGAQESPNTFRQSREELAALPQPSTKALVNSLFSLNYTKAMALLSSLYNASV